MFKTFGFIITPGEIIFTPGTGVGLLGMPGGMFVASGGFFEMACGPVFFVQPIP